MGWFNSLFSLRSSSAEIFQRLVLFGMISVTAWEIVHSLQSGVLTLLGCGCAAILLGGFLYLLATREVLVCFVAESTAKTVMLSGHFSHVLMAYNNFHLNNPS